MTAEADNGVPDLSHLDKLQVKRGATADYELVEVPGNPIFTMVHAGESNRGYYNSIVTQSAKQQRKTRSGHVDEDLVPENREHDRYLFPMFVIQGWDKKPPVDAQGKPLEFNHKNCSAYINRLPDYIFDPMRAFAAFAPNFIESADIVEDAVGLGNS